MEDTLNASSVAARCWLLLWSVDYGWELGRIRASSAAAKGEERGRGAEAGSVCKGGMELLQRGRVEPGWLIVVGLIHLQLRVCSIDGHELSARPPTTGRGAPPWAEESDSFVPDAYLERDWSGLTDVHLPKCGCGLNAIVKRAWGGKNTGRRFFGCPVQDNIERCQFVESIDAPWPQRLQHSLKELWKELKTTRRCEARANEELIEAIRLNYAVNNAKVELEQERMAISIAVEAGKLKYLVYCLLTVIVVLALALFRKN
ncbi:hypothetical protein BDA96_09G142000 [Sorghum bicolor]|uniref:Zinc finger GRF-type domain-containing protein n=1 Tax=Sorghum bicolor TaxID=4558 RepID=A0A921U4V7_SORBI|nr:hypothetical protein BDA96_09G142000 [Sorghum bicolor]